MIIEFDFSFDGEGNVLAVYFVDTADPAQLETLVNLKSGALNQTQAGWDVVSKHPKYQSQYRFQVALGEIVRLNDTPARTALSI